MPVNKINYTIKATLRSDGGKYLYINDKGEIWDAKAATYVAPSQNWRILHATEYGANPDKIIKHYTLKEILDNPVKIKWRWKNGNQRVKLKVLGPEILGRYIVMPGQIRDYVTKVKETIVKQIKPPQTRTQQ